MKDSLKNKLKTDYEKGTTKPSSELWAQLEAKLEAEKRYVVPPKIIKINYWKYAAVVLLLISVGFIYQFVVKESNNSKNSVALKLNNSENAAVLLNDSLKKQKEIKTQFGGAQGLVRKESSEAYSQNSPLNIQGTEKVANIQIKINGAENKEIETADQVLSNILIENSTFQVEEKQHIAKIPVTIPAKKSNTIYIKADELLFGRELQKNRINSVENGTVFGEINISIVKKLKAGSVKILGRPVFSEEQNN